MRLLSMLPTLFLLACIGDAPIIDTGMQPDSDSAAGCYEHRWTRDGDGDGWGRWDPAFPDSIVWACLEAQPSGYVLADGDCDDTRPDTYPGAPDTPRDGLDSDCDGVP